MVRLVASVSTKSVVFGGSGFIGSGLAAHLEAEP